MSDRRAFLRAFGLGAVGIALDPERLLWVPGRKRIFLPPSRYYQRPLEEWMRQNRELLIARMTAEMEEHFINGTSPPMAAPPRGFLTLTLQRKFYLVGDEAQP